MAEPEARIDCLQRDLRDGILHLTLNRPTARNALSRALLQALLGEVVAAAEAPDVRVVVIAGAGAAFCSGHDLKELRALNSADAYQAVFRLSSQVMLAMIRSPVPVIARVHGVASAAGCQLVASCDLAIASEDASFATPGVNIGLFCSTPMVSLSRNVPRKRAMEMLLTGEAIGATDAADLGLVNRAVPATELDRAVTALAQRIAAKSRRTVAIGKEAFYRQIDMELSAAYDYASQVMAYNMLAADAEEGIDAFLGKRAPVWRDA